MIQCNAGTSSVTVQARVSAEPFPDRSRSMSCKLAQMKWGLTQSPSCDCGQQQTTNHIVDTCPLTKSEGGLNLLHDADDDTVIWLESTATAVLVKWMNSHEKEEVGLQTCTEDWYRGCQSDVMRQTVSGTSSSNRKCSVTDDGKARVTDDQWLIDWYKV